MFVKVIFEIPKLMSVKIAILVESPSLVMKRVSKKRTAYIFIDLPALHLYPMTLHEVGYSRSELHGLHHCISGTVKKVAYNGGRYSLVVSWLYKVLRKSILLKRYLERYVHGRTHGNDYHTDIFFLRL
jgi:hypothetical protein